MKAAGRLRVSLGSAHRSLGAGRLVRPSRRRSHRWRWCRLCSRLRWPRGCNLRFPRASSSQPWSRKGWCIPTVMHLVGIGRHIGPAANCFQECWLCEAATSTASRYAQRPGDPRMHRHDLQGPCGGPCLVLAGCETHAEGFEPSTLGSEDRCSIR